MKTCKLLALLALLALSASFTHAAVVSTTVHGTGAFDLDPSIALGDLLSGRLGTELPPSTAGTPPIPTPPINCPQ